MTDREVAQRIALAWALILVSWYVGLSAIVYVVRHPDIGVGRLLLDLPRAMVEVWQW